MVDRAVAHDRPLRELCGVVERITFQSADNGFTVARLAPERPESVAEAARGEDRVVTVVGTIADLTPGQSIVAWRSVRDEIAAWLGRATGRRSWR
jgi:hypothetical protein